VEQKYQQRKYMFSFQAQVDQNKNTDMLKVDFSHELGT